MQAIQGYRETEKKKWREKNAEIIERIRSTALPQGEDQIAFVHVLDLAEDGYIKPHIDSVRVSGAIEQQYNYKSDLPIHYKIDTTLAGADPGFPKLLTTKMWHIHAHMQLFSLFMKFGGPPNGGGGGILTPKTPPPPLDPPLRAL